jgi:hypothetical protein
MSKIKKLNPLQSRYEQFRQSTFPHLNDYVNSFELQGKSIEELQQLQAECFSQESRIPSGYNKEWNDLCPEHRSYLLKIWENRVLADSIHAFIMWKKWNNIERSVHFFDPPPYVFS